jgi:hypothetical protein
MLQLHILKEKMCSCHHKVLPYAEFAEKLTGNTWWEEKGIVARNTSMVVVLLATKDMCMIRKPSTLKAKARFSTVPKAKQTSSVVQAWIKTNSTQYVFPLL